jgi:hypothetical protein
MDVAVRLYLGYLLATFVIDSIALIYVFLWQNRSCNAPGSLMSAIAADMGQAFMCGFLRILTYVFVSAAICVEVYCLFIVWSLCEEVHEGANGVGLWELLPAKQAAFQKSAEALQGERLGPYDNIVGLAHSKLPGSYPSPYGALESSGFQGHAFGGPGNTLFGGQQHEMSYPPAPEYARW